MFILIYFTVFIVCLLAVKQIHKLCSSNLLYKLPSPPTLPFIGNGLQLNDSFDGLWNTFRKYLNDYYPIVCFWIISTPLVLIRHPDDIQTLLKSKSNVNKADIFYGELKKLGHDGVIISGDKKWQERRKLINKAFLRNTLKSTAESAHRYAEIIIKQMLQWKDESIQNIWPLSMKYSLDIISDSAMGYDLHTVGAMYEEEFSKAYQDTMAIVMYKCTKPYLKDWLVQFLPLRREEIKITNIIQAFSKRIMEERRNYLKSNGINILSDDFMSDFDNNTIDSDIEGKLNVVDILLIYNAKGLIPEEGVIEEIETLILAGCDTTGIAVTFTLLLLAENENEQNLARKEVIDVMKKCGGKLTTSDLQNLQYLDRCIKETLRLFPSVPMIGRKLVEDTQFSKYVIPRNTDVFMNFYDLHRDPNFWPEPNKFKPDRFLPEVFKDQHPFAYSPFSRGPRGCIGQKHSFIEIKTIIAHVLYNFYLKPVDFTRDISFNLHITLKTSVDKLRVKFIKIANHD